jgi:hypothetical protein
MTETARQRMALDAPQGRTVDDDSEDTGVYRKRNEAPAGWGGPRGPLPGPDPTTPPAVLDAALLGQDREPLVRAEQMPSRRIHATPAFLPGSASQAWPATLPSPQAWPAAPPPRRRAPRPRLRYLGAFLLLVGLAGAYWLVPRSGLLQISVKPPNARLAIDGVPVTAGPPFEITKRAGIYRLTVAAPGYLAFDRNIQISARQRGHMDIALVPSPDTSFELTSTPPGALVWLDDQPLFIGKDAKQATTDLRALGIAPGPHVVEIKDTPEYQRWGQEFIQEPGRTVYLHAELVPMPKTRSARTREPPSDGPTLASAVRKGHHELPHPGKLVSGESPEAKDPFENLGSSLPVGQAKPGANEDIFDTYGQ